MSEENLETIYGEMEAAIALPKCQKCGCMRETLDQLAAALPPIATAGKTETENIGIDKVVKNIIGNPAIEYLVLAGNDPAAPPTVDIPQIIASDPSEPVRMDKAGYFVILPLPDRGLPGSSKARVQERVQPVSDKIPSHCKDQNRHACGDEGIPILKAGARCSDDPIA